MAFDTLVPGSVQDVGVANFVTASGTLAKILVDVTPARMLAAITGEAPAVSRPLQGGQRVIDATASSTNASANNLVVYDGLQTTVVGASTGAVTPTANTLVRTTGRWDADGLKVGDSFAIFAAAGSAFVAAEPNEGLICPITAVSADGKTITTSATLNTNALQTGSRIVKLAQDFVTQIPANAGNSATIQNVALLANAMDSSADRQGSDLGPASVVVVSMQAAIAGAGAVSVRAKSRGY